MATLHQSLIAFTLAAALLTVTPGLDTALVLRTAAVEGARRAFLAALGICLACLLWGLVVATGLGLLLQASTLAYAILKWAGAAYLIYIGLQLLLSRREEFSPQGLPSSPAGALVWFRRGIFTNLLNPKVGIFYVSFLPQFIPAGADVPLTTLLLAAIHSLLGLTWFLLLIAATRPLSVALQKPKIIRRLDRLTGGIFLLFGARVAWGSD